MGLGSDDPCVGGGSHAGFLADPAVQPQRVREAAVRCSLFALRLSLFAFRFSPFAFRCSLFAVRLSLDQFTNYCSPARVRVVRRFSAALQRSLQKRAGFSRRHCWSIPATPMLKLL